VNNLDLTALQSKLAGFVSEVTEAVHHQWQPHRAPPEYMCNRPMRFVVRRERTTLVIFRHIARTTAACVL